MVPDFWKGGVNAALLNFYDIVFEITSTATGADFSDHYDLIQDWLAQGNKNYFLAGDETFALLFDGQDTDFAEGDIWYDLGIAYVFNDICPQDEPAALQAIEDDLLSGDLFAGIQDLGDGSILQYDPDYEIGLVNRLDGFEPTENAESFLFDSETGDPIAIRRYWLNGNKTVLLGFDPLSLNSAPTYHWWGASAEGPTKMALNWFFNELFLMGDVTGDYAVDILDIVMIVAHIMDGYEFSEEQFQKADMNDDGLINVQDVVIVVGVILGE